jgi:MFS family permease
MFIVPLGDLIENRKLVLASVALSAIALAAAAFAPSAAVFLICAGAIGLGSVAVQILVPLAANLAPDATRGRVVGMVSSGLMIGIMLARPVSSFIAAQSSWRVVFIASAAMMVALAAVLARALPGSGAQCAHDLWRADRLDGPSGGSDADPAPPRVLPGIPVFSPSACSGRRPRCCSSGPTIN